MNILVVNCGSSSIKADILDSLTNRELASLRVERVTDIQPTALLNGQPTSSLPISGLENCLKWGLPILLNSVKLNGNRSLNMEEAMRQPNVPIHAVGHRVAHGGAKFDQPTLITPEVLQTIEDLIALAPLHNPANLAGIRVAQELLPEIPHVAVFDTAFHQTMPKRAIAYALPKKLAEKYELRRYGFHGTSHQYVCNLAANHLKTDIKNLRIISCHLGNGASVAAIEYGRSVETSMGMTPLEGLVMGTRAGDIDAGLLIFLAKQENWTLEQLDSVLNKESGLKGLSGIGNDMRDIIERSTEGDEDCRMALQVFTHRLRKYIGAYAAIMGGVDVILFTGGIGENSPVVRHRATQRLDYMGIAMDEDMNHDIRLSNENPVAEFSASNSRVKLLAVRTNEQLAIAKETQLIVNQQTKVNTIPTIPIAVSARHVHLTQETVEILFGKGYQLTEKAPLSQPGQFACNEQVTLVGTKNQLERVRILGPVRPADQVEISRTDEFFLGLDAPVRESGKIENTPGIKLIGTVGEVTLKQGVICAWRHIHMTPEDAALLEVADKDVVEVQVSNGARPLTFGNVLVRVSPNYKLEMHIDTDEANAAELPSHSEGVLVGTNGTATLIKKKV